MLFFTNMSCITSKIEYVISWLKSIPKKKKSCVSEMAAKSLSVVEMLKLGKVIHGRSTEIIQSYTFHVNQMSWSRKTQEVEFAIEKEPLGIGGEHFKLEARWQVCIIVNGS